MGWRGVLLLLLVAGCGRGRPPQGGPPPTPVTIEPATAGVIRDQSEYVARVEAQQLATLRPQVSGQVRTIAVSAGQTVQPGQVILTLDGAEQQAVLASRQAAVAAAQQTLQGAQAVLATQEAEQERRRANLIFQQELFQRNQALRAEGVISQNTLDANLRDLRQAEADLAAAAAAIQAQQAAIARAERDRQQALALAEQAAVQLQFFAITAPIPGRLGDLLVRVGDYVTPQTPLTTIQQDNNLDIVVGIPLERAPLLRLGLPVELLDEKGQGFAQASTYFIDPQTDLASQGVTIKARYTNAEPQLRPGQFLRVRITWAEQAGILVPLTAITRLAGQNFVFVAQPSPDNPQQLLAAQVPVQLGSLQGNGVHVLAGLTPGQPVVTSGVQKLFPNAPIVPASAQQGSP
ncbi:MAG: efflux RND transporter periplasmic adaptor subunit [Thermostichales cyanobacterium HHBFW_bins_127]